MRIIVPGTQIAHFRVQEKIGAGSFGEVYKAEDIYLQRPVALKLLTSVDSRNAKERFLEEARFCSSLVHPNVAVVYEAGWHEAIPYLAMELVEGELLSTKIRQGQVTQLQALEYIAQILEALEEAHSHGIIHRDIKSSNVMITPRDKVKILDFGLARTAHRDPPEISQEKIFGTMEFLAPELARGEEADERSDLFSAGVVLYHMLSGRLPFERETRVQTYAAILQDDMIPLTHVADPVNAILQKALSKERESRYQTATEFLADLRRYDLNEDDRRISVTAPIEIAVLYFDLPDRNQETEYLRLGITEDLITDLSRIAGLRVLSRHAIAKYRDKSADLPWIARELQVRYVLHGYLKTIGDQIEIQTKLFDAVSGAVVWSDRSLHSPGEMFSVQESVSKSVSAALHLRLTASEQRSMGLRPTESLKAYEYYLKGRHHYSLQSAEDNRRAEEFLQQALAWDSQFAAAMAALSEVYVQRFYNWFDRDRKWLQKAEELISRAAALNDHLSEVHCTLGMLLYLRGEYQAAMEEIQKAIRLDPHYALAHDHSGEIYLHTGDLDKALLAFHTELRINPEVIYPFFYLVWIHSLLGEYPLAQRVLEQAKKKHAANSLLNVLRGTYASYSGDLNEAESLLTAALASNPNNSFAMGRLAVVYACMQNWSQALDLAEIATEKIDPMDHHAAYDRGSVYALQKDTEKSFHWLQTAVTLGWRCRQHYEQDPNLTWIRQDQRFKLLLDSLYHL